MGLVEMAIFFVPLEEQLLSLIWETLFTLFLGSIKDLNRSFWIYGEQRQQVSTMAIMQLLPGRCEERGGENTDTSAGMDTEASG